MSFLTTPLPQSHSYKAKLGKTQNKNPKTYMKIKCFHKQT